MKYLEDKLAEQCLSKTLYPDTIIHVSRKKVKDSYMTYTNELEVEIDFSDVDPKILKAIEEQKKTKKNTDNSKNESKPNKLRGFFSKNKDKKKDKDKDKDKKKDKE